MLPDKLIVPGLTKVVIDVEHDTYVQYWSFAVQTIKETNPKMAHQAVLAMSHRVMKSIMEEVLQKGLLEMDEQALVSRIVMLSQKRAQAFIPGVSRV